MIIDMCMHPAGIWEIPEALKERMLKFYPLSYGKRLNLTTEEILREMDEAGVDIGVLRAQYSGKIGYAAPNEKVAVRYRDLKFVVDGLGEGLFEQMYVVLSKNPGVHTTTNACTFIYPGGLFERHLKTIMSSWITIDRVLFASEYPLCSALETRKAIERCGLSLDDRRKILGEKAARLLKLE